MTYEEASGFIRGVIRPIGGVWADLGAGNGTFTLPISDVLGRQGKVFAIDQNKAVRSIKNSSPAQAPIIAIQTDFTARPDLPLLDGILMANALHFVRDQESFLASAMEWIKHNGIMAIIEYDRESGNPWVPYPVSLQRLKEMASRLKWPAPKEIRRRKSLFGKVEMYVATIQKE